MGKVLAGPLIQDSGAISTGSLIDPATGTTYAQRARNLTAAATGDTAGQEVVLYDAGGNALLTRVPADGDALQRALTTEAILKGYNGATLDTLRTATPTAALTNSGVLLTTLAGSDGSSIYPIYAQLPSDDLAQSTISRSLTATSLGMGFNGTTWDRMRTALASAAALDKPPLAAAPYLFDYASNQYKPAASATGDGYPSALVQMAGAAAYNGFTWDRQRNNTEGTLLASAARTVEVNTANQTNYNSRGVLFTLSVTAKVGVTTIQLLLRDASSGAYYVASPSFQAIAGVLYVLLIYPGVLNADLTANYSTASVAGRSAVLPRTWLVTAYPSDADSVTYSLYHHLIV